MTEQEQTDLQVLEQAMAGCQALQDLAVKYGIKDIFQDNGGKVLQSLIILGLTAKPGREGNDAVDNEGNEYELKTLNISLRTSVTTHHHLNLRILGKYRQVKAWYISLYENIVLKEIYRITPDELKPIFDQWENRLQQPGATPINNPKIPLRFIIQHGTRVYPASPSASSLGDRVVDEGDLQEG
jgi:restriction endonuclease PvuII